MYKNIDIHHRPTGFNQAFNYQDWSFSEYLLKTPELIAQYRLDLDDNNPGKIITANSPFELRPDKPAKTGILLIHGLYGSPFWMRDLGEHFYNKGCLVRSILLPGHGTAPGDLLHMNYEAWLAAAKYGIESFSQEVEEIILIGYSTGGLLAMYHALQNEKIDALILFAPALKIRNKFAHHANIHKLISWAYEPAKWLKHVPETDYAKYESLTFDSIHQVYLLGKKIVSMHKKHSFKVPIYICLSKDDAIIDSDFTLNFFNQLKNPQHRLRNYTTELTQASDPRIVNISSAIPEKHIINFSHTCITNSPHNPHYGIHGDYQDFQHYQMRLGKRHLKKIQDETYLGAVSKENLKKYHMRRLTYNPDFENMLASFDAFLGFNTEPPSTINN